MKALRKTITYRILAFVVGGGTTAAFLLVSPTLMGGATGLIAGEVARSGLYYIHEKAYEEFDKPKPKEPGLHEYHKKYGVDNI